MDLCIKTDPLATVRGSETGFNPCFNGSMYKNPIVMLSASGDSSRFNPCFNGSMYKNIPKDFLDALGITFQSLF